MAQEVPGPGNLRRETHTTPQTHTYVGAGPRARAGAVEPELAGKGFGRLRGVGQRMGPEPAKSLGAGLSERGQRGLGEVKMVSRNQELGAAAMALGPQAGTPVDAGMGSLLGARQGPCRGAGTFSLDCSLAPQVPVLSVPLTGDRVPTFVHFFLFRFTVFSLKKG